MTKPTKEEFQERNSKHTWFVLMYGAPVFLLLLGYAVWSSRTFDAGKCPWCGERVRREE